MRTISRFYIAEAANDQAAIDAVAGWDAEPTGTDYLAVAFNPKKATPG